MTLSRRGQALADSPTMPTYLLEHFARSEAPYGPDRPDGYIALCVAENRLVWDVLEPMVNRDRGVPPQAMGYDDMAGSQRFREALAHFLETRVLKRAVQPDQLVALAGAGTILEVLFYALADAGDAVLVPTPSYAGFWMDLEVRDALRIVPVHATADTDFQVTTALLDAALEQSERPVRALLFTSPNNPLGTVYSPDQLRTIVEWAEQKRLHVVFDEVYALSVFGEQAFTSASALRDSLGDYVHVVWAFSKDFAASGLRCGVLYTENEALRTAVSGLAYWSCVSGDTQHLLTQWLTDTAFVDRYITTMQQRLGAAHRQVTSALDAAGVPYLPGGGGFFVLLDLRSRLTEPTWEAEEALWRRMLDEASVNLTPGHAMRCKEPGLFRLCFASAEPDTLAVAMERLARILAV